MTSPIKTSSIQPDSKRIEHVGDYIIQNRIGQGSFATVYKAQHKDTQQTVAIKCVKRSKLTKKLLENLESEISILTAIRHDNIVGLIECQKTESNIFLVMEFCSLGDLSHYIKEVRSNKSAKGPAGGLPERVVRHFLKQLANALQFLRSQNLIHRDIKPQNLLLTPPPLPNNDSTITNNNDLPVLKVADFGFARFLPNASLADTLCGSPLYMGPEILSYKKYDAKADLWSVGAVLYEMVTGRPPFRAQNHIELLKKIQENNDQIHFPDERHEDIVIGSDIKDLIRKLLKKNPQERLSFEDFFQHPAVLVQQQQQLPQPIRRSSLNQFKTTRHTPPSPRQGTSYEPPPFAQTTPKSLTDQPQLMTTRRWSTTIPATQDTKNSPLYSKARPTKTEAQNQPWTPSSPSEPSSSTMHPGTKIRKAKEETEEEDVLHEYVVLDIRSIETNQFADELKATPRSTPIQHERRLSRSPSSVTNAVNIPNSPSAPPFIRERKSSTGSSAGSVLAKAISKASVRLFGTSMPSPPKDHHHLVGSPHGFMSHHHHDTSNNRTMKRIERLACMAHAVAKYGDLKYESLNQKEGDVTILAEEALSLYVKSLALLEMGLYIAQQYWHQHRMDDEDDKKSISLLNDAVQWMRDKFNECLDRAESIKCEPTDSICVEKLLYDRALEMSKAAAVHELVGENITECEQNYQTAIWMLEAILQVRPKVDVIVEEDDRRIINQFIDSIRHRITVLRKKMDISERV